LLWCQDRGRVSIPIAGAHVHLYGKRRGGDPVIKAFILGALLNIYQGEKKTQICRKFKLCLWKEKESGVDVVYVAC